MANFKTGNQVVKSISVNADLWKWCESYAKARDMKMSEFIQSLLEELKVKSKGSILPDGDHTNPHIDMKRR